LRSTEDQTNSKKQQKSHNSQHMVTSSINTHRTVWNCAEFQC